MRRWALAAGLACALATCAATSAAGAAEERYWLGSQFEGLTLTDTSGASFIYGDCDPVPDGCAPPLEVQNASTCGRNPVGFDVYPKSLRKLRGGGIVADYGDGRVEVGTGRRTVVVFANVQAQALRGARQLRRRSQSAAPARLAPPRYPRPVLAEIRRALAAREQHPTARAIQRATGLSRAQVVTRLRLGRLLGPAALRGVPVPARSWRAVKRERQVAFEAWELGERRTARENGITPTQLRRIVRRVRGLVGGC